MSFANPAGSAQADAASYTRRLLDLLGDRDPWQVQAQLPDELARAVAGVGVEAARRPEEPGKWSIAEVAAHLADTEVVYAYRMRRAIAQPGVPMEAYDQDAWARELRYRHEDLSDSVAAVRFLRERSLRFLRSLPPELLERGAVHAERGLETVERMLRLVAAHDLVHLAQIGRIRRRLGV
jgi:uncharacterized damage-inducible protein DinB